MASRVPVRSFRVLSSASCHSHSSVVRPSIKSCPSAAVVRSSSRAFSTTPSCREGEQEQQQEKPRWSYTPPGAKAPFSLKIHSKRPPFPVNEDPAVLDKFYIEFLGPGGDKMLSEEVKWLAVTHKSFDQGRRGFNDRLAFLGKRIVQLQVSLALVQNAGNYKRKIPSDPYGRQPFEHPALEGLENLTDNTKNYITSKNKLSDLAQRYNLQTVLRWSPRMPDDLTASGLDVVLAHTMYAIIGAIALEKGGQVANKVAQERILSPLGLPVASV
ncbi:hypothetical protein VTN49DRAFT_5224 [Thermomyces lanuginosus]|uniref:mitochondrial 54S ribosomal protein mL57 n=1 Tax=Thermomyces lanuginosus TaxID=5541 RepID=UPI0037448E64